MTKKWRTLRATTKPFLIKKSDIRRMYPKYSTRQVNAIYKRFQRENKRADRKLKESLMRMKA